MLSHEPARAMAKAKDKAAAEEGGGRKKRRSSVAEDDGGGGGSSDGDGEEDRAAKKGRKAALKATRRLARALGAKFRDGSEDDGGASDDDEQAGPFAGFPTRKEARKLSEGQREALVRPRRAGAAGAAPRATARAREGGARVTLCLVLRAVRHPAGGQADINERAGGGALVQACRQVRRSSRQRRDRRHGPRGRKRRRGPGEAGQRRV